jgi:drug/metabolite transporter (DMT)-like permease
VSVAALIFVSLIWGATFVLVKRALDDISTLLFLTLRFLLALSALGLMWGRWFFRLPPALLRQSLKAGTLAGICLFSGYVLQTFGLKYTTPAKAGFLTGLYIPLVPLFGAVAYREFPRFAELLGVACAFAGMGLLTMQHDLLSIGFGDLLVIACAVAYAFHILVLGHFAPRVNVPVLTMTQIGTAALLGCISFWWAEPVQVRWSPEVWAAIGITSLMATALAFAIQTWAQQHSSPTRTALIFSLEPVFAWATSYIVLGEVLNLRGIMGAALILGGILLVELKPPWWR